MATLKAILEAALFAAGEPLNLDRMQSLFEQQAAPSKDELKVALAELEVDYEHHTLRLKQTASGYSFQVRSDYSPWVQKLFTEKPQRYSRALLETLAIIAYRQPATRAEIEDIRGVAVSSNIFKTLLEREWIKVVGHREVPGRPSLYATTHAFLDHFNLKNLAELPTLIELENPAPLPELLATAEVETTSPEAEEVITAETAITTTSDAV